MNRALIATCLLAVSAASVVASDVAVRDEPAPVTGVLDMIAGDVRAASVPGALVALFVVSEDDQPKTLPLCGLRQPNLEGRVYAYYGWVCYEGVQGTGYLEMWSVFPDGNRYFTRTLADDGPLQSLSGSSNWRRFELPFRNEPGRPAPTELLINVVLPGRGKVAVAIVGLVESVSPPTPTPPKGSLFSVLAPDRQDDGKAPASVDTQAPTADAAPGGPGEAGQWWTDRQGGLIGGIFGGLCGCLGGVIGVLAGRGKGRRFVMIALKAMVAFGLAATGSGVAALICSQPYHVYCVVLVPSGVLVIVPAGLFRVVRRRYERVELRRIAAKDAGG
ncbi:MAG: hypothetical protein ACYS8X_03730 [Planctomycetota bacterium]|jgi:hypothetical protein